MSRSPFPGWANTDAALPVVFLMSDPPTKRFNPPLAKPRDFLAGTRTSNSVVPQVRFLAKRL
jgi:hypothetical protein